MRWDIMLLTAFYKSPHTKASKLYDTFCAKYKLTESIRLRRVPPEYVQSDVYSFVARYLKTLYKVLEHKDITDIFDLAETLQKSKIDIVVPKRDDPYVKEAIAPDVLERAKIEYELMQEEEGRYSRRNWAGTKERSLPKMHVKPLFHTYKSEDEKEKEGRNED